MKAKILGVTIGVAALAGGLMFCGDSQFFAYDEPSDGDEVTNEYNAHDEPTNTGEPATLTVQLARSGYALPTYFAVRVGDDWKRPAPYKGELQLELPSAATDYTIVSVCDTADDKGRTSIHTTVIEATVRELPTAMAGCASAEIADPVQVSGLIRNVHGQPAILSVGDQSALVSNPKEGRNVLFNIDAAAGTRTFAASVGSGDETEVTFARGVQVAPGTPVELDMADGQPLRPLAMELSTDGAARPAGGTANLWIDGRTRIDAGALSTWTDGDPFLGVRTTGERADYLDIRAAFRGPALPSVEFAPIARARFIAPSTSDKPLVLPELNWVGPSYAYVAHDRIEFAWSPRNWAVFGHTPDDELALFAPVAYVGSVRFASSSTHHMDIVVTPNRVRGAQPFYRVPDFEGLDGWQRRWSFPSGQRVHASSGNLSAYAGAEVPNPATAIAAFLDPRSERSPAELGVNDNLTVVVAGSPIVKVDPDKSLADLVKARCVEQRPCSVQINENVIAAKMCPDIAAYDDCREDPKDKFNTSPAEFVRDLKHEIISWYQADAIIPNALPLDEALGRISEDNVHLVTDRTSDEWWTYDPEVYQVYWHPDPTRANSPTTWYGAYLAGRLVSIHAVNWDGRLPDGEVEYCRLETQTADAVVGVPSEMVFASVFADKLTPGDGQGEGIEGQIGWGSDDRYEQFQFAPISYAGDVHGFTQGDGISDLYGGRVTADEVGTARLVARFRREGAPGWTYCDLDGNENGITADQLGAIEVEETGDTADACHIWYPQVVENAERGRARVFFGHMTKPGITGSQERQPVAIGELLVGPPNTNPADEPDQFLKVATRPSANPIALARGEDEYIAAFAPPLNQLYAFAFRFSVDGGTSWRYCGLQDRDDPSGEFSTDRMGSINTTPPTDLVDHCNVMQNAVSDDADPGTLPTLSVQVFERDLTVGSAGANAADLVVEAVALPREVNPVFTDRPWTQLAFKTQLPEMYEYEGSPYTAESQLPAGEYSVVARVRRADGTHYHYCDADPVSDSFAVEGATKLFVTP